MRKLKSLPRGLAWVVVAAAVLALPLAVSPGDKPDDRVSAAVASGPNQSPCSQSWLLQTLLEGGSVPAMLVATPGPADNPFTSIRKTCRCSCGFPCKNDGDCGPGGRCGVGITCCRSPLERLVET